MSSYDEYKQNALLNSTVKAEYDALESEYDLIQAMIDEHIGQNATKKGASEQTQFLQTAHIRDENVF